MSSVGGSSGSTERTTAPLTSIGARHRDHRDHRHAADVDARRHHRHRRVAADAGRSESHRRVQELGHHRLRAGIRRAPAARRPRRRCDRPQTRFSVRRRGVHHRVAGVRPGDRRCHADRGPGGARHRCRGGRADRPGAHRDDLRRRTRPQPGDGDLGSHAGHRLGARPCPRRRAHGDLVAAGVSRSTCRSASSSSRSRSIASEKPTTNGSSSTSPARCWPPSVAPRQCWCSRRARRAAGSTRG